MKFIASLFLSFFFGISLTTACICEAPESINEAFKNSDLIVHAKVLNLEFVTYDESIKYNKLDSLCKEIEDYPLRMELYHNEIITKVEIEVIKVFKGKILYKNLTFFTPKAHTSCGYTAFNVGGEFLLYATESYHTLWGDISIGADFALSENFSIEGQLGFSRGDWGDGKYTGIPITAFGKYYFNPKNGADRFYLSVFTRYINRSVDNSFGKYSISRLGLGVGLGYKIVSKGNFVFDIGVGIGRAVVNFDSENNSGLEWIPIMFAGKLGVGYRF